MQVYHELNKAARTRYLQLDFWEFLEASCTAVSCRAPRFNRPAHRSQALVRIATLITMPTLAQAMRATPSREHSHAHAPNARRRCAPTVPTLALSSSRWLL
jgi:hypothetical protein